VQRAVAAAARGGAAVPQQPTRAVAPPVDGPQSVVEREALKLALQAPVLAGPMFDALDEENYRHPVHVAVRQAVADAGGAATATGGAVWIEKVRDACADLAGKALVGELAVESLRLDGEPDPRYVSVTLARLQLGAVDGRIRELKSKIQRINPVTHVDDHLRLFGELISLEQQARALREQAAGGF
jgi:DNA primase